VLSGIDLSGKHALVTGASAGIGYETARALAAAGARVFLAGRDADKGSRALERLRAAHPDAQAELAVFDLGSFASIKAFTAGFGCERLDILVCNAGIFGGGYRETADGFERTVGVCHLGHFLLARELMERLLASRAPRVVLVSSESHRSPRRLDFERLPLTREHYSDLVAYGQAKLCNVLHAKELWRRYAERGLSAYALHPGTLVTTDLGRDSLLARVAFQLARPFSKSPHQGAATSVLCAAHPAAADFAAEYFNHCRPARSSRESNDPAVARRLWDCSERWLR
jgi:WW domain-containing oxidoreductase